MGDEAGAGPQDSHPLVLWLHDELTSTPFELSLVVTTSQQAATSLCRGLLRHRSVVPGPDGLLGVYFLAAAGLARTLLQLVRAPHPHRPADPLLEREILRGCLADHPGELSEYAASATCSQRS